MLLATLYLVIYNSSIIEITVNDIINLEEIVRSYGHHGGHTHSTIHYWA